MLELVNDLTADGFYKWAHDNDLTEQAFVWTPNTADGAKWEGSVTVVLPGEIGAGEWGADLESTVTLPGTGTFTITPSTAPAQADRS